MYNLFRWIFIYFAFPFFNGSEGDYWTNIYWVSTVSWALLLYPPLMQPTWQPSSYNNSEMQNFLWVSYGCPNNELLKIIFMLPLFHLCPIVLSRISTAKHSEQTDWIKAKTFTIIFMSSLSPGGDDSWILSFLCNRICTDNYPLHIPRLQGKEIGFVIKVYTFSCSFLWWSIKKVVGSSSVNFNGSQ